LGRVDQIYLQTSGGSPVANDQSDMVSSLTMS
jgi:hypothetical protein